MKCAPRPFKLAYKALMDLLFLPLHELARQPYYRYKLQKIMKKTAGGGGCPPIA